jgi:hypothetical protein
MRKFFIFAILFLFASCGRNAESVYFDCEKETPPVIEIADSSPQADAITADFPDLQIHWDNGITQYASRIEGNERVLYALENSIVTRITAFPSLNAEWGLPQSGRCFPQSIFHFDVADDWLIMSVGEIQGTMRNFFGDLWRVKNDGSTREPFGIYAMETNFHIINGWIYYNIWDVQTYEGWHRFRLDGTGKEYMGDYIHRIFIFADDGYIYGEHMASGQGNFARWQPEINEPILLFPAELASTFEEYFTQIGYTNIRTDGDYVYFTVAVSGYRKDSEHIGWREPPWEILHTADFRVSKCGGNLTLPMFGDLSFFLTDGLVASITFCCDNTMVFVEDIFDSNIYFASFSLRQLTPNLWWVGADTEIIYLGGGEVEITELEYWDGFRGSVTFSLPPRRETHRFARILDFYAAFVQNDFGFFGCGDGETFVREVADLRQMYFDEGRCNEFVAPTIMYAFHDINGDGAPELFIGNGQKIHAIYAWQDGMFLPSQIAHDTSRTVLNLSTDIYGRYVTSIEWAQWGMSETSIFALDESGELTKLAEITTQMHTWVCEYNEDNHHSYTAYSMREDSGETIEITRDEFLSLHEQYGTLPVREVSLDWRVIAR